MALTILTSKEVAEIRFQQESIKIDLLKSEDIAVLKKFRDEKNFMTLYLFMFHTLNETEQKIVKKMKRLEILSFNKSIGYTLSYSRIIKMVRNSK